MQGAGAECLHSATVPPPQAVQVTMRELVYPGIARVLECFTPVSAEPGMLEEAILMNARLARGLQGMIELEFLLGG